MYMCKTPQFNVKILILALHTVLSSHILVLALGNSVDCDDMSKIGRFRLVDLSNRNMLHRQPHDPSMSID